MDNEFLSCKVRGGSPWLSNTRGGVFQYENDFNFEDLDLPRGAGWREFAANMKNLARNAWAGVKKIVIPYLKKEGPAYAQKLAEFGAQKARDYVEQSNRFGPAAGLIKQVLLDVPQVVTDIVSKKVMEGEEALDEDAQQFLLENVRGSGGGLPAMTQSFIVDARPYLERACSILLEKFNLIDTFAENVHNGKMDWNNLRLYYEKIGNLDKAYMTDDQYAQYFFTQLMEEMILQAIQHAEAQNLIFPGSRLHRFLIGANRLQGKLRESPETAQFVEKKSRSLLYPKTPLCSGICTLKESVTDIDPSMSTRGGFAGAALLASTVIPAIAGLIPSITQAIQDWRRGSGIAEDIDMSDLPEMIINALQGSASRTHVPKLKAICGVKRRKLR
jgi:hypothetical protein